MKRRDAFCWRVIATGLCFALFAVGGLLLSVFAMALSLLFYRNRKRLPAVLRRTIHVAFRVFVATMQCLGVLECELHGIERLRTPGQLIVANHPSLIDIVLLIALVPGVCIVKQSLLDRLPYGPLLKLAGYIGNSSAQQSIDGCVASLHDNVSVIVFPEGTRMPAGVATRLHRGAAYTAMASHSPVVPVHIRVTPPTLGRGEAWYKVPASRVLFEMWVGEPITPTIDNAKPRALRARAITAQIKKSIWNEVGAYG
jgi:1-acyl-sn-glycerol-3-phosphate acyltransferase